MSSERFFRVVVEDKAGQEWISICDLETLKFARFSYDLNDTLGDAISYMEGGDLSWAWDDLDDLAYIRLPPESETE